MWVCFFLYHPFFPSAPVPIHLPHPPLPNSPSVQRQGTGSRHWLDFHTIPSTERHIKLIRVNNCGGALLSGAPISLAWPGHDHTDGLVICDLEAEGTERGGGTAPPPPLLEGDGPAQVVSPMKWNGSVMLLESVFGSAGMWQMRAFASKQPQHPSCLYELEGVCFSLFCFFSKESNVA